MRFREKLARLDWVNTLFLIISPLLVLIALPLHLVQIGFDWGLFSLFVVACWCSSLAITAGYHRHFSHRSYQARPWLRFLYLIFGAAALQGSAMKWSTDHRRHHRFVDTDEDPYTIKKGFWYAHMGWVFLKEKQEYKGKFAPDLAQDPLVAWQHRYYWQLAVVFGFLVPLLIGWSFSYPWGGLLYGGFARVVVTHHCTFFINSLCHWWGARPFDTNATARDNPVMAFLTYGEGYHNFHHRFQIDYRNGIKWYQWDPTKWLIWMGSITGVTWGLKTVKEKDILKARWAAEQEKIVTQGIPAEVIARLREQMEAAQAKWVDMKLSYRRALQELGDSRAERVRRLRREMLLARLEFKACLGQWRIYLKTATVPA